MTKCRTRLGNAPRVGMVLATVLFGAGCAHHVARDYSAYLAGNTGQSSLGRTQAATQYLQPADSRDFSYTFRALSSGIANRWIVDIGQMLDDQLQSSDVQTAFDGLEKVEVPNGVRSGLLAFELQRYNFDDFAAHVAMQITYYNAGQTVLAKEYSAVGRPQATKMILAGVFGQKNAVQQSTWLAVSMILNDLINDLNSLPSNRARAR